MARDNSASAVKVPAQSSGSMPPRQVSESLRSWMGAVLDISRAVNAAEPLGSLLTRVAEQACSLIGFEFCAVFLADKEGERLFAEGWHALSSDYVRHLNTDRPLLVHPPSPEMDSPSAQAYRDDVTVVISDVTVADQFGPWPWRDMALELGYHAVFAVPLRTGGSPAGALVAYSTKARRFTKAELELAELLTEQAAVALQAARLRAAEQEMIDRLSRANAALRRQDAALEWADQQHRRLMRLVLDDVGLAGVVESLAAALHASVTVEDVDGRPLAVAADGQYVAPPPYTGGPAAQDDGSPPRYEVVHTSNAWVAPVVLGGRLVARLWVCDPRIPPDAAERRSIEGFALVVALELVKQRNAIEVELRLSRDVLTDLVRGEGLARGRELLDRAAALGHDLTVPHTLVLASIDRDSRDDDDGGPRALLRAPRLVESGLGGVRAGGSRPLIGVRGDSVILLLPARAGEESRAEEVARQVQRQVGRLVAPRTVSVVIGATVERLEEYATAYRVARGAAELLGAGRPGRVVDVGDLGVYALLLENGTPTGLRTFADRLLGPIRAHDRRRGTALLETLRVWLRNGCSAPATATALVVHPNTVTYRLGRIEQLVGGSLRQHDMLLQLQLALTVRDVEGDPESPRA